MSCDNLVLEIGLKDQSFAQDVNQNMKLYFE